MDIPEPSDSNDLNQIMQQMLTQNAAAAEAVIAGAQAAFDETVAENIAAQAALNAVEQNKDTLATEFYNKHRARIEKDTRERIVTELTRRLLRAGESLNEIAFLLEVPDQFVISLARDMGMTLLKDVLTDSEAEAGAGAHFAWLTYENQGRAGAVVLHLGKRIIRFWHEQGASKVISVIDIPEENVWEAQTGLPLAQRRKVLEFVGLQVVLDHAPECSHRIGSNTIVIYR